jgi:uncharacterized protein YcnI
MRLRSLVLIAALLAPSRVSAHVTLQGREAAVGADYRAIFVVPHGCAGSPTIKLRVQIPAGVIATGAKPVAGWNVETIKGKYAATYDYRGARISEGITEVDWSGGKLPDKTRQEFEIETFLTDSLKPGSTLYFPAVQECEQGVSRWIEIPANGAGTSEQSRWPAPAVKLTAP